MKTENKKKIRYFVTTNRFANFYYFIQDGIVYLKDKEIVGETSWKVTDLENGIEGCGIFWKEVDKEELALII